MLNDKQRKFIEDNIKLVYKFCARYNITDEDDISDFVCKFCELVESDAYDEDRGKFSTFIWASLNNYAHYRYEGQNALKRNLAEGERFVYLNKMIANGKSDKEDETEIQELVQTRNDYFDEVDLGIAIEKMRKAARERDNRKKCKRRISNEKMLDIVLYYYKHENGEMNITEVARALHTTKQTIFNNLQELRKSAKRCLE